MVSRELQLKLLRLNSFDAFAKVLDGYSLEDFQCIDTLIALSQERCIIRYDTGMGKTLIASAIMRLLKKEVPSRKFIFVMKNAQMIQTPKKIIESTGLKVTATTAEQQQIDAKMLTRNFTENDVLMITHECLNSNVVMEVLHRNRKHFCGIVIDEAHELNNYLTADRSSMLVSMVKCFRFCYALTATPITTNEGQLAKLMHIVDHKRCPSAKAIEKALKSANASEILDCYPGLIISRTRKDLGILSELKGYIDVVKPTPYQMQESNRTGVNLFNILKGEDAEPQIDKLISVLLNYKSKNKKGLVFVNQHAIRENLLPNLERAGLRFKCINGKTKMSDRKTIMYEFNVENSLDVIITSVTTSVDLDCDFIYFYEFTADVQQMIGRGTRGLNPKKMDVRWMITESTPEVEYFFDKIVLRSLIIKNIFNIDISSIEDAWLQLKGLIKVGEDNGTGF